MNEQTPNPQSSKRTSSIFFGVIFIISVLAAFFLGRTSNTFPGLGQSATNQQAKVTIAQRQNKTWKKPISTQKGYPIASQSKDNVRTFSIYSFSEKKLKPLNNITVDGGGGGSGVGTTDPLASPDLLYTVYIDQTNQGLWLLSNETRESTKITDELVDYISGWTPNSKKIIYQIGENTILSRSQGYGEPQGKITFDPQRETGFFVFDIEIGTTTKLTPLSYFEETIDSSRILTKAGYESDRLVVFNFETFEADYGFIKDTFGYGANQFNFTDGGKKWTYTLSRNPTEDANIIYTDFPNKEGIEVDSGGWADVQWPKFSPNGSKIAYEKREGYIRSGVPKVIIWIYDTNLRTKKGTVEGGIEQWVDENTIVLSRYSFDTNERRYYSLDLTTNEVTPMQ